jgi:hypothetical protein
MGFSVSLQSFEHGTFSTFERSIAYNIFGNYIYRRRNWLELWYGDEFNGIFSIDDQVEIDGVSIERPGNQALCGLYELARLTPSLITWPEGCAVANTAFLPGIPEWLLDAFKKPPAIVHDAEDPGRCLQGL